MLERFLGAKEEPEVLKGLLDYQRELNDVRLQVRNPAMEDISKRITRINIISPGLEPGVILALAQSNASDDDIRAAGPSQIFTKAAMEDKESDLNNKNPNRSLWDRIYGGVKTGLRWAGAAGETVVNSPLDILGSSLFDVSRGNQWEWDPKNPFRKGWWASTALGTMMAEAGESGEGFAIGGEAMQNRTKRLGDYAGWVPLSREAGAGVDTQFDADPMQVDELAQVLVRTQGLDYDEALKVARAELRAQLKTPYRFFNVSAPLVIPSATLGATQFRKFEDLGSSEAIMAGVVAELAAAFALPDPTAKGIGAVKKGFTAYRRGRHLVDEAGNFVMDFSNSATNADEAIFLADADFINVAASRFEAAGLDASDAAVERLTPQPGTWYHGSTSGPVGGFVPLAEDYPGSFGGLYGPGLYTSENAIVSQSTGYQPPDSTSVLGTDETSLLGAVLPGEPPSFISKALENPNKGTLYVLKERQDAIPTVLDIDSPFPQERIPALVEGFNKVQTARLENIKTEFAPQLQELRDLGFGDIIDNLNVFGGALTGATPERIATITSPGSGIDWWTNLRNGLRMSTSSPELAAVMAKAELPPTSFVLYKRTQKNVIDFVAANNRFPKSADELYSFAGGEQKFLDAVTAKASAKAGNFVDFTVSYIDQNAAVPKGSIVDFSAQFRTGQKAVRPISWWDEYAYAFSDAIRREFLRLNPETKLFDTTPFVEAGVTLRPELVNAANVFIQNLGGRFDFEEMWARLIRAIEPVGEFGSGLAPDGTFNLESLGRYVQEPTKINPISVFGQEFQSVTEQLFDNALNTFKRQAPRTTVGYDPQFRVLSRMIAPPEMSPLVLNLALKESGVDALEHLGGGRLGGGQLEHKVRIWLAAPNNLEWADPLTGASMPLNTALRELKDSGQYLDTANELREQAEQLRLMAEMGAKGNTVDGTKMRNFFTTSPRGKWVGDQVWRIVERTDENKWYDLWEAFKGRLPLEALNELASATSRENVTEILSRRAGWTPGVANLDDINLSTRNTLGRIKEASRVDRLMDKVDDTFGKFYGRSPESVRLEIFGSERQKTEALRNLDSFLSTAARVDPEQRRTLVAKFAKALASGDKPDIFQAQKLVSDAIYTRIFAETGDANQASIAAELFNKSMDDAAGTGLFDINAEGLRTDNNYAALIAANPENADVIPVEMAEMLHGGPGLLSELIRNPLELPDVQKMRRATSFLGYFTGQQGFQRFMKKSDMRRHFIGRLGWDLTEKDLEKIGELRLPLRAADFMMNSVWKNMKKFSLAYAMRNNLEAQATMYLHGDVSMFNHPVDYMMVAGHMKLPDDLLLGEAYNPGAWRNIGEAMENAGEGYREFLTRGYLGTDQRMDMVLSEIRNGGYEIVSKESPLKWAKAASFELRKMANDPITQRFAKGMDTDAVMAWLYSDSDDAKAALNKIESLLRDGEMFFGGSNPRFGSGVGQNIPIPPTRENVRIRVEALHGARLEAKTAGDGFLTEVIANRTIGGKAAFTEKGAPTQDLLDYLQANINNDALPNIFLGKQSDAPIFQTRRNWFDKMVSTYFDNWVGWEHNLLDRSPLWRLYYSQEVNRLAPLLSKDAATELMEIYASRVRYYDSMRAGFTVEALGGERTMKFPKAFTLQDYVGPEVDADELMTSLRSAKGGMSREELHILANSLTMDRLEGYLFNASARNSITDAARAIAPFGAAWAETTKRWAGMLAKNPENVARAYRNFGIAGQTNDVELFQNKGLIHKDPSSGEFFYSLPFSYGIASFLANQFGENTGARYGLEAPVKGLNMALNFVPGVGPVVGYPLGQLLYTTPQLRDFATFFMPYGPAKSPLTPSEYLPGWLSKIVSAFLDSDKQTGVVGDTMDDVLRAEIATGKWNLQDPLQRQALGEDVKTKAKVLTILRAIGQGIGPSAPQLRQKIRTESGEAYAGALVEQYYKMLEEEPDTATNRFLSVFGDDVFAYMAGKTREVLGGIEADTEFAKWQLDNADLFDSNFRDVAGYFGPKGSTYDWAIWNYQVEKNQRERIPPFPVQLELAEQAVGMARYREYVAAAGPRPNKAQRDYLASKREELQKEFPGMLTQSAYDVNKFDRQIEQLKLAVNDPRLADNEIADAVAQYLQSRDFYKMALEAAGIGWASETNEFAIMARANLNFEGTTLAAQVPGFTRVFDRLLSKEVEK